MRSEPCSQKNGWINDFAEVFVRDMRGCVHQLTIEVEADCVVIRGWVTSFYAVQLAIISATAFSRHRPYFAATRISLDVNGRLIDLQLAHPSPSKLASNRRTSPAVGHAELSLA